PRRRKRPTITPAGCSRPSAASSASASNRPRNRMRRGPNRKSALSRGASRRAPGFSEPARLEDSPRGLKDLFCSEPFMTQVGRILVVLALLASAGCAQKVGNEFIWVGHVAPLNGAEKAIGEHERQGILLAVEEANRDDQRILGRRVAVQHVDDRGDADTAQAEAVRLITVNRVFALLGGSAPAEAERLARTAQANAIAAVMLSPLPPSSNSEGVVSLTAAPAQQGRTLGRFAAQKLKPARAAVIADSRSSLFTDLAAAFGRELPKDRAEEWTYESDSAFPDLVRRLRKLGPETVLIAASARDFLQLARLVQEAELKTALVYGGPAAELPLLTADRATAEGVYLATP